MIKSYSKKADYSYTLGTYPTREILKLKPEIVEEVILSSKKFDDGEIQALIDKSGRDIPVRVDDKTIERLAAHGNCYSMAKFAKYESKLEEGANHLVLVMPEDMGNAGTIMRTMVAFNYRNLAIISPGVDVFNPRVVRSAMGSLFAINVEYFESIEDYQFRFSQQLYPFMTDVDNEVGKVEFAQPHALVFGSESSGLDGKFRELGTPVTIYQSEHVDSLNLAVAVGIGLHSAHGR